MSADAEAAQQVDPKVRTRPLVALGPQPKDQGMLKCTRNDLEGGGGW